ncbi:MAG: DUF1592 domain-containing protein [Mariniblastus sp.]|nr:DUF1592 domain-containing protein [Mariniblastus sp.]
MLVDDNPQSDVQQDVRRHSPSRGKPWIGTWLLVLLTPVTAVAWQDAEQLQAQLKREFQPLLQEYCGDCHWGADAEGGLDLEQVQRIDQLLRDAKRWQRLKDRVRRGQMPPPDAEPLPEEKKQRFLNWLGKSLNSLDCTDVNPGNVSIRRLNRTEYQNTIKSLTGVDYSAKELFPRDDVGYGFDNIAGVLSLSPMLMERYLDAAEEITSRAIVDPRANTIDSTWAGANFESDDRFSQDEGESKVFLGEGRISRQIELPAPGRYELTITAFQESDGDDDIGIRLIKDGRVLGRVPVSSSRAAPEEFRFTFITRALQPRNFQIHSRIEPGDAGENTARLHVTKVRVRGPIGVDHSGALLAYDTRDKTEPEQREVAAHFLGTFAERAFRRPVNQAETDRYLQLYDQAYAEEQSFAAAVQTVCQAILISPPFLFRIEQPITQGETRELSGFELASSLSYFLWSDMPDDELFRLAAEGRLTEPAVWRQQVDRMLQDDRSLALVENFYLQWLQLRSLDQADPDPDSFPRFTRRLLPDMNRETAMLFQDILRRDASVLELLQADFTYLNSRLARHYGIPIDRKVSGFQRVDLSALDRSGGLLTHASILTLTSNPNRTSPVRRGKWVMETLLGREPPPPIPDVVPLDDQRELQGTTRQRLVQHRSDPNCASCHETMDAIGFAMENFDAIGRWRETDEGLPVDATSQLPDGTQLAGVAGLRTALASELKQEFLKCLTEKMLIYSLGRGLEYYDQCAIDLILDRLEQDDYRISTLIQAITESEPFRKRRGQPDSTDE